MQAVAWLQLSTISWQMQAAVLVDVNAHLHVTRPLSQDQISVLLVATLSVATSPTRACP